MTPVYKVLIIGCGNMAGGYDLLQPTDALPLSHAKAFSKHTGFALTACVEPDFKKRAAFQKHWKIPVGFENLEDAIISEQQFDVISICSPSNLHVEHIQLALTIRPKLIFCEKPVTLSVQDTKRAIQACSDHQVLLAVNYSRRWSPEVIQIKQEIGGKHWGDVRSVSAIYNKGILNNGSHMLDLLIFLFGSLHVASVGRLVPDFFPHDPTVDATLYTDQGVPIQLNVAHAQDYTMFEMQIVTEKGVICMEDGGARWRFRRVKPSEQLAGYRFLNSGEWVEPQGSYALTGAVTNIYDALHNRASLMSTGINALQAQILCEQIKETALANSAGHVLTREVL